MQLLLELLLNITDIIFSYFFTAFIISFAEEDILFSRKSPKPILNAVLIILSFKPIPFNTDEGSNSLLNKLNQKILQY